jgi:translation initiation factor RLI1
LIVLFAGKVKPNLGLFDEPPEWQHILAHFRGSELQNYFTKIVEDTIKGLWQNILLIDIDCLFVDCI